MFGSPIYSIK